MKRIKLLTLSCLMSLSLPSFAQFSPDHKVSLDKGDIKSFIGDKESKGERKVYKGDELTTIGMPVGGICAGQLYVRGDGTLANWWIANNAYNTGYGIDWLLNFDTPLGPWKVCYQTFEPMSYIDQGFKITVNDGNKTITKELNKKDFDDISFIGEYPIAFVEYAQKKQELPVRVSAEFYSPFIPLDAKSSATPATIMKYTVKNTSDKKVTADLEGWMQNLVCIDLKGRADGMLQNKVIDNNGWKSVYMDMRVDNLPAKTAGKNRKYEIFDNFESGNYSRWKVEGTAFGRKPASGEQCNQNNFGGNYGNFLANSYTNYDKPTGKLTSRTFTIRNKYISFKKAWDSYVMYDERTQFNLQGNPMALLMYLPGYVNTHEGVYSHVRYDKVARKRLIEMPATFEFDNGVAVAITEAAIRDYAGMYLVKEKGGLVGKLSPKLGQEKIKVETDSFPHRTPWRVISVADRVGGLLETNILTSLNEPCRIEDTSWIKPCRTTFTWWNGNVVPDSTFSPGNNFDTNKYYIDFAARNGLDAHGIYGYAETPWYYDDNFNFGWAGPNADVTKPIPCLNMPRIVEYARSKGVGIHLWVHWRPLYDKLEEAFALYEGWGVRGLMVDFMDRNDQEMIRIQEEILECAARHRLFIQFHGSSKPSGLVRTYPNEFTREGTLNYEVCKWDTLVNADHDIAIPFTRMLAGATDYHLGGFRALPRSEFKIQYVNPHVMSTRCHMLAMYVVLENHLTSLCDTPKAYEGQPGFEVLRTVPGTWDEIRVPLARMNEHVTVARRSGSDWWVGSLNNGTERDLKLELDFLSEGDYQATIYTDAEDVERNPNNLDRQVRKVTRKDIIELNLAKDGGALLHIRRL